MLKKPAGGYRLYLEPGNGGQPAGYRYYDCSNQFTGFELGGYVNTQTPMRNGKVIAVPGTTSFTQWQAAELLQQPAGMRGPLDDPDRDELSNLVECATGLSPSIPDADQIRNWFDPENRLRLLHTRNLSMTDVSLGWQIASTLPDWQPAGETLELRSVTLMSDGRELLEWVRMPSPVDAPSFFRLRASTP